MGGTWYHNRYPGARCDVESVDYCYSFSDELQQEWTWTEVRHPGGDPGVTCSGWPTGLDLRRGITFNTRVTSATFDEQALRWRVTTDTGEVVHARFCIMATGPLSAALHPDFRGLDTFAGEVYHTAYWPHDGVDFTGKRVAVIGTGSSGVQSIPIIARQAEQLYVFQRTPNYSACWKPAADRRGDRRRERRTTPSAVGCRGAAAGIAAHHASEADAGSLRRSAAPPSKSAGSSAGAVLKTFADQMTDLAANEEARKFYEEKVRASSTTPRSPSCSSPTTTRSGPSDLH